MHNICASMRKYKKIIWHSLFIYFVYLYPRRGKLLRHNIHFEQSIFLHATMEKLSERMETLCYRTGKFMWIAFSSTYRSLSKQDKVTRGHNKHFKQSISPHSSMEKLCEKRNNMCASMRKYEKIMCIRAKYMCKYKFFLNFFFIKTCKYRKLNKGIYIF